MGEFQVDGGATLLCPSVMLTRTSIESCFWAGMKKKVNVGKWVIKVG